MTMESQAVELQEKQNGKIVEVKVTGKLTEDSYKHFMPRIERLIQEHGKIRILFYMQDFEGWTASALWEDMKFDWQHFRDIERLAIVGESQWEKGMAAFCKPFTTADIRYFNHSELPEARSWIAE